MCQRDNFIQVTICRNKPYMKFLDVSSIWGLYSFGCLAFLAMVLSVYIILKF